LFRRVRTDGPQRVVRHGGDAVILVAAETYEAAQGRATQPKSLVEFFRTAPDGAARLALRRRRDASRTIRW
jgi:prevent-host-death family protein